MKKIIAKSALIILYFIFMLAIMKFQLHLLINLKLLLFVMIGTLILTMLGRLNGLSPQKLVAKTKLNFIITGLVTTFLSSLSSINEENIHGSIYGVILYNFLALFYGLFLAMIIDVIFNEGKSATRKNTDAEITSNDMTATIKRYHLTNRETMIAEALLTEMNNKEIGDQMYISENTVKKHIQNVYKKTGVSNRSEFKNLF